MRDVYYILIIVALFACSENQNKSKSDTFVPKDSLDYLRSNPEIIEQTVRLLNATPCEETISDYLALLFNHINDINKYVSITDSLFLLLDSSQLKESTKYNIDRTRLMYLFVLRDFDAAELITRTVFNKNNPENLKQNYIDFELNYHLAYIKAIKNECDSAELYRDRLNSVVEYDPTAFYDFQLENHEWIKSWLSEQCD